MMNDDDIYEQTPPPRREPVPTDWGTRIALLIGVLAVLAVMGMIAWGILE